MGDLYVGLWGGWCQSSAQLRQQCQTETVQSSLEKYMRSESAHEEVGTYVLSFFKNSHPICFN